MPSDLQRFADNLRKARTKRGWSQEHLAHEAGLHWTSVSKIERAEREPRLATILRLARALHIRPAEFFRGLD